MAADSRHHPGSKAAHLPTYYEGLEPVNQPPGSGFDGLQAVRHSEDLPVLDSYRSSEGLQYNPTASKSELYSHQQDFGATAHVDDGRKTNRRRLFLILAIIATIVVVLAAILGGVLGSQAVHRNSGTSDQQDQQDQQSPSPAGVAPASPTQTLSTKGAWNGTAITALLDDTFTNGAVCFQDYTASVICTPFQFLKEPYSISLSSTSTALSVKAANNTALTSFAWLTPTDGYHWQVIYVASDGTLSDIWQYNHHNSGGPWFNGNLSIRGFQAPTSDRPTMIMTGNYNDGYSHGHLGGRLFAGGPDNHVHMYSYDYDNATWYPNATHDFDDAWAFGGGWTSDLSTTAFVYDRNVLLMNQQGSINRYVQSDGYSGDANWPYGGPWSTVVTGGQNIDTNASLGANADSWTEGRRNVFLQQNGGGKLSALVADFNKSTTWPDHGFGTSNNISDVLGLDGKPIKILPGSDMSILGPGAVPAPGASTLNLVFYQDEATSIAWMIMNQTGTSVLASGHIVSNNNGQWMVA